MAASKNQIPANMMIYEGHRKAPEEALKPIQAGRLKGMSDINPMWRLKALTEEFGPCGIGWYYTVDKQWLEPCGNETVAFVNISMFIKVNGEWSKPIFGTGGSKIITMERSGAYVSDECVDGDCEVLTRHGWVKFKNYNGEEEIAQFDKDSSEISFVKPLRFIHKTSSNTYKKGNMVMTYGHRNLYETAKGERKVDIAENLCGYDGRGYFDIHCGTYESEKDLTPMQKVGIMLCCDGTKHSVDNDGNITWNIAFSKERKINRCKELLTDAGIEIKYEHTSQRDNPNWGDYTQIRFTLDNTDYKTYSQFLPFANYRGLLDELIFWDGNYSEYVKSGNGSYFSVNYENVSHIQTLLMLSNQYSTIYIKEREGDNHQTVYTLYNHKSKRTKIVPIERYGEETEVYCVEVPSTFFMLRKDNNIIVTGNCFKMALTDAISVCCKQLGFAADVYWAKDRTKYDIAKDVEDDNLKQTSQKANEKSDEQKNNEMIDSVDKRLIPTADNIMTEEQYSFMMSEIERTGQMENIIKWAGTDDLKSLTSKKCCAALIGLVKKPTKKA